VLVRPKLSRALTVKVWLPFVDVSTVAGPSQETMVTLLVHVKLD
jgi:hypothetical protein